MSEQVARAVAAVGFILAALGVLIGVIPVSVDGERCGGAFWRQPGTHWTGVDRECGDKRSTIRVIALPLVLVGGGAAAFGVISAGDARRREDDYIA